MSLTKEEKDLIRESWKRVCAIGLQEVGLIIFVRLFTDHPNTILLFKNVVSSNIQLTVESLRSHPKMEAHALSVASSIGAIVALLDSPAKLNEELDSISEIHMDKQVKPTDFESLGEVLLNVLKDALKKKTNDDVIVAWSKAYGVIKQGIFDKMEQQ